MPMPMGVQLAQWKVSMDRCNGSQSHFPCLISTANWFALDKHCKLSLSHCKLIPGRMDSCNTMRSHCHSTSGLISTTNYRFFWHIKANFLTILLQMDGWDCRISKDSSSNEDAFWTCKSKYIWYSHSLLHYDV